MVEPFKEIRTKFHRPLELRLRSDYVNTALGNPENIRQGVERLMGYAGYRAGIPAPRIDTLRVTTEGPVFSLAQDGAAEAFFLVSGSEDPSIAMMRLALLFKLLPARVFGMEQAIRWVELSRFQPYVELSDKAAEALNDSTGCERLGKILHRLMEERLPLTDVNTILETVAAEKHVPDGDDALWDVTEKVRTALREGSAKYYLDYYNVRNAFRGGADLMGGLTGSDGLEPVKNGIANSASAMDSTFMIVVDEPSHRRQLWELTEKLFLDNKLNRPAVVLKASEVPSEVDLPDLSREIRLISMQGQ